MKINIHLEMEADTLPTMLAQLLGGVEARPMTAAQAQAIGQAMEGTQEAAGAPAQDPPVRQRRAPRTKAQEEPQGGDKDNAQAEAASSPASAPTEPQGGTPVRVIELGDLRSIMTEVTARHPKGLGAAREFLDAYAAGARNLSTLEPAMYPVVYDAAKAWLQEYNEAQANPPPAEESALG